MTTARTTPVVVTVALIVLAGALAAAQWRTDAASVPRITLRQLQKLISQDDVLVIDTRDVREYQVGHIPGSISIPLGNEAPRVPELREQTKQIVTYCT